MEGSCWRAPRRALLIRYCELSCVRYTALSREKGLRFRVLFGSHDTTGASSPEKMSDDKYEEDKQLCHTVFLQTTGSEIPKTKNESKPNRYMFILYVYAYSSSTLMRHVTDTKIQGVPDSN